jgi:hypothetical protein
MFQRFFGRKDQGATLVAPVQTGQRPHAKQFPPEMVCGAGCGRTTGYRCAYRDQTGARCGYWCEDHSVYLNGRVWCQRHANSVKWLRARDGSIFEIVASAAVDDRSPNLAGIVVDELNGEVRAHLISCFQHKRGVHIVTDANIRTATVPKGRVQHTADAWTVLSEGPQTAWERGWGVYSQVGYLARVVLRVTATEPPIVHLYVNGALILSRIPDWIVNRGKGTDAALDHANFRRGMLNAIQRAVIVEDPDA